MYFVTCFQKYELSRLGTPDIGAVRTFGYYTDRATAIAAVEINSCDIQERVYRYAVVECIPEGLYQSATERIFFEWNEEKEGFEAIGPIIDDCGNYAFG